MRRTIVVPLFLLAVVACEPVTQPTTTDPVLPPPDPVVSTTSLPVSTTEFVPVPEQALVGSLPDGLDYRLLFSGGSGGEPIHIAGNFVVEVGGETLPAAEVDYRHDGGQGSSFNDTHLLLTSGGWTISIDFYQEVWEALGDKARQVVTESIDATNKSGYPVLRLRPPFSWDYENHPPEVRIGTLVVRRFCGDLAIACNDIRSIQVIPAPAVYPGLSGPPETASISITSLDSRSVLDPHYLDPGPLIPRNLADVHWTGDEMYVWGGGGFDEPYAIDGARFDLGTNEWTTLPPIPLTAEQPTRSIMLGSTLLVVSEEGSFLYSPGASDWYTIGHGVLPPRDPGFLALASEVVYLWSPSGLFSLDVATGQTAWVSIEDPPLLNANAVYGDRFFSGMAVSGESLYVSVRSDECSSREYALWDGVAWHELPSMSLATDTDADCSYGFQMVATPTGLIVWDAGHPTMIYSAESDTWTEADPIPVGGQESPSSPVPMDDRYFMVLQDGRAAFFDGDVGDWSGVDAPVFGIGSEIVWTGQEFLAWTGTDAWRWSPPQGLLIGGDDAS